MAHLPRDLDLEDTNIENYTVEAIKEALKTGHPHLIKMAYVAALIECVAYENPRTIGRMIAASEDTLDYYSSASKEIPIEDTKLFEEIFVLPNFRGE